MATYSLRLSEPRPYFAEIPYYLWGEVNYDSDGDCARPTDRSWHSLYLKNRDTREVLEFNGEEDLWQISGPEPYASRAALFWVHRCGAEPLQELGAASEDVAHTEGMQRAARVAHEFESPKLKPFDSHLFWGSWKWVGWFGTEFTWVGRWIMHSVVRGDSRAVSLCIDWLRSGTYSPEQSAILRYALKELTGVAYESDEQWLKWYDGGLFSRGQKHKYPEPDFDAWLLDLKAQSGVS